MGGKTHVGSGTLPLSSAIMQVNTPNKAKINLAHQKSKTQTLEKGCLEMECLLKPQLESKNSSTEKLAATATSTVKLPLPKGNYKILFTDMEVFDLFNAGNLLDKQDPCVEISLNSQKLQTARYIFRRPFNFLFVYAFRSGKKTPERKQTFQNH